MSKFTYVAILALAVFVATCSAVKKPKKISLRIPDGCKATGFCNIKPVGYDELMKFVKKLLKSFLVVKNHMSDRFRSPKTVQFYSEFSTDKDWPNCPTKETTESPYFYKAYENQTELNEVIIQLPELKQQIDIVNCAYEDIPAGTEQCFQPLGLTALGLESACQTEYSMRTLLVYRDDKIEQKAYPAPCCCLCKINQSI